MKLLNGDRHDQHDMHDAMYVLIGSILGKAVSALLEVVSALRFGELINDGTAELPEFADGSFRTLSKQLLEC